MNVSQLLDFTKLSNAELVAVGDGGYRQQLAEKGPKLREERFRTNDENILGYVTAMHLATVLEACPQIKPYTKEIVKGVIVQLRMGGWVFDKANEEKVLKLVTQPTKKANLGTSSGFTARMEALVVQGAGAADESNNAVETAMAGRDQSKITLHRGGYPKPSTVNQKIIQGEVSSSAKSSVDEPSMVSTLLSWFSPAKADVSSEKKVSTLTSSKEPIPNLFGSPKAPVLKEMPGTQPMRTPTKESLEKGGKTGKGLMPMARQVSAQHQTLSQITKNATLAPATEQTEISATQKPHSRPGAGSSNTDNSTSS